MPNPSEIAFWAIRGLFNFYIREIGPKAAQRVAKKPTSKPFSNIKSRKMKGDQENDG